METWQNHVPPEVAPVRPGEELDWDRLDAYVRSHLEVDGDLDVMQFPNGSANLTYLLRYGEQSFVLRRPPFGVIAPGAHDMKREFRVLSRLWQEYDRAPRAFLFCDDHGVVGSDFVVSEYRRGEVIWAVLPPSFAAIDDAAYRIGLATVDALADLHNVDPARCDLADLGRPDGYMARQLAGWRKRWDLVATEDFDAIMSPAADELERRAPTSPPPAILHNDFKIDNCQFVPGRPDRVSSVFDWDMATLGDPLADLGTLLNYWPDPSDTPDDRALHVPGLESMGLPDRSAVVARYADRVHFDVGDVAWYEAFACWRTCVILQQLHQRYVRGESTDERMASRGDNIPMLARRAARLLAARS
ncbi:phosphotransferase family protein [Desertimonas flava]|jgi:aminoglycoside phosphotransferase (APT) family kinase protein|uniref:phosphotransferase family protein n=1 Tax=Desertimonas flava TaxID=2064846 RepID=UPI000E3544F8|nr:phosphotransferase family protein [Desertimonas flava]